MRYIKHLENKDLADPRHDPARVVHDEAERGNRIDPHHVGGVRRVASVLPRRPSQRHPAMLTELERDLAEITGFAGISLQPNSGAQVNLPD